jgi:hypothetical protein
MHPAGLAMANLKKFIESVLFAGLKPARRGQAPAAPASQGPLRRLWARIDRWASGVAPDDPLYLSNRTWQQKLRVGLIVGIPGLLVVGGLALVFGKVLLPPPPPPQKELTTAEIVAKVLPNIEKTANIERYEDAEIVEIGVDRAVMPPKLRGKLKNNTSHKLSVEFAVDLSESDGTRVGAESERISNIPAHESVLFDFSIKPTTATVPIVRSIRTIP